MSAESKKLAEATRREVDRMSSRLSFLTSPEEYAKAKKNQSRKQKTDTENDIRKNVRASMTTRASMRGRPTEKAENPVHDFFTTSMTVSASLWKRLDRFTLETRHTAMRYSLHDLLTFALDSYDRDPSLFLPSENSESKGKR